MLVSVIIPYFNAEQFIERAINSVVQQSYRPIEIIVVDNNSTDNTALIVDRILEECNEQTFFLKANKQGAAFARNIGLEKAQGSWIQFLDADDELHPDKILHQVNLLQQSTHLVVGNSQYIVSENNKISYAKVNKHNQWLALFSSELGNTCSNLWRRDTLLSIGGWNENLKSTQEYDLLFRLLQRGINIIYDEEILTTIHRSENSISTGTGQASNWLRVIRLRLLMFEYIKENCKSVFVENQMRLKSILFRDITQLAVHDQDVAKNLFKQQIGVIPHHKQLYLGKVYTFLYTFFNFSTASSLYRRYLYILKSIGKYPYSI